jgi:hypothetical protein
LAKKPPPEHTRWKPGQSGNKAGKPKNLLTQDRVKKLISDFSQLTIDELRKIKGDPKSTILEVAAASHLLNAPDDTASFNFVLERSIGKVKDVKEIVLPKPTVVQRRDGTQMVLGAEMKAIEGEVADEVAE